MGENSNIEWTDHTFNIVEGCQKVSPACANCYAERRDKRIHSGAHWGVNSTRKTMSAAYWEKPLRWNKQAEKEGKRYRVFCSSLADVFEDHPTVNQERERLFYLINDTPHLDWLLLTKRPENITPFLQEFSKGTYGVDWNLKDHLPNVWLGTTVENEEYAEKRIPELLKNPAKVLFLSCEPLLGRTDISLFLNAWHSSLSSEIEPIDWVIAGGESGANARPSNPDWFRFMRDQCINAKVPFLFKQWGEFNLDGNRVGKKTAGRELDGRTWVEFPK